MFGFVYDEAMCIIQCRQHKRLQYLLKTMLQTFCCTK